VCTAARHRPASLTAPRPALYGGTYRGPAGLATVDAHTAAQLRVTFGATPDIHTPLLWTGGARRPPRGGG
jgi:hypothetical protein